MSKQKVEKESIFSYKFASAYSIGQLIDVIAYQSFNFLIFTFYFAVVGLNVVYITIAFIIWSFWNAINDPLIGHYSDKTNTRWGRRTPYIIFGIGPLCIIMILLWTPPPGSQIVIFFYFLIIIILFELFYTMYSLNSISLFPEMFENLEERAKANSIRQVFIVLGLVLAFIFPTLFIPKLDDPKYITNYLYAGIFLAIVMAIGALFYIRFGVKERKEFSEDHKTAPSFFKSSKITLKNKNFIPFLVSDLVNTYVLGMLPTLTPLFGSFVLGVGEGESILLALLLGLTFISALIFAFLWRYVAIKIGVKKGYMLSQTIFILTLLPLMFISNISTAFVVFFLIGIGLSGALMFPPMIISAIIDDDELLTGIRREGAYYGMNSLIIRLSTIFIFISIGLVFTNVGWAVFNPDVVDEHIIFGLRILMCIFPAAALCLGIVAISRFPITKQKYEEIKQKVEILHAEKREKISQIKI